MKNVGGVDRAVRFGVAVVLILTGLLAEGNFKFVFLALALIPLATATFRFCPLWIPLKINTYKK